LKKEDEKENEHLASLAKSMRIADFPRVGKLAKWRAAIHSVISQSGLRRTSSLAVPTPGNYAILIDLAKEAITSATISSTKQIEHFDSEADVMQMLSHS
jgi:hypothetical protein